MFKRSVTSVGLVAISCLGLAKAASADEVYRINLTPPTHVGDRLSYNAIENDAGDDEHVVVDRILEELGGRRLCSSIS